MAHSFVEAHDDELTAFEHFATANPNEAAFILDTYDTEAAARKVVSLAKKLAPQEASKSVRCGWIAAI